MNKEYRALGVLLNLWTTSPGPNCRIHILRHLACRLVHSDRDTVVVRLTHLTYTCKLLRVPLLEPCKSLKRGDAMQAVMTYMLRSLTITAVWRPDLGPEFRVYQCAFCRDDGASRHPREDASQTHDSGNGRKHVVIIKPSKHCTIEVLRAFRALLRWV